MHPYDTAGRASDLCVVSIPSRFFFLLSQRFGHGEEEAAYLPHSWLREGVWQDVPPASPPALAQRGETLRLQLDVLRQEVHQERRASETQEDTHR